MATDYLRERRRAGSDWTPYLGLVGLDLTVGGEHRWPSRNAVGDLARMAFQFESAGRRLAEGEPALVRIAVDDSPLGAFFRFRPRDDIVDISLIILSDPDIAYRYPVGRDGGAVSEVYAGVADLSATDASAAQQESGLPDLRGLAFPRDQLVSDLTEEAARGRELYDELGQEFYLELY